MCERDKVPIKLPGMTKSRLSGGENEEALAVCRRGVVTCYFSPKCLRWLCIVSYRSLICFPFRCPVLFVCIVSSKSKTSRKDYNVEKLVSQRMEDGHVKTILSGTVNR